MVREYKPENTCTYGSGPYGVPEIAEKLTLLLLAMITKNSFI